MASASELLLLCHQEIKVKAGGGATSLSMASPFGLPCSILGWLANFAGEHTFRSPWGKLRRDAVFMLLGQAAKHHTASCLNQQE